MTIIRFLKERPLYTLNRQEFIRDNRSVLIIGAIVFVVVLLLRSWENFSNPAFFAEDATYYFKLNYNSDFSLANIFRNPNGYYNIFNNFIAQLIGKFDIRIQALGYQTVAMTLSVLVVILFSRSGLIKNKFLLLVTPLVLGLSGLNHLFYYTTITFQMYLLVLALLLVLLWEKQESLKTYAGFILLIPVLAWSGPYSVLAVPFAVLFMLFFRGKDVLMIWTIIVVIVYTLSTTGSAGSTIMFEHLFSERYQTLWFDTIVGDIFIMGLRGNVNIEKVLLLLAIFGPAVYVIRRDAFYLRILGILFAVIILSMAPLFLTNKYIFYRGVYPCHILIAQFSWLLFVLILLDRLLFKLQFKSQTVFGIIALLGSLSFVVVDNIKHPEKWKIEVQRNIPLFSKTVHEFEQLELEKNNQYALITADGIGIFDPQVHVGSKEADATLVKKVFIPRSSSE